MQLLPDTAEGIAQLTGGSRFVGRPLRPRDQRPLRLLLPPSPLAQVRRRAPGARRIYNAGQANVDDWISAGEEEIPFPETREFVDNVLEARDVYARAYADELRSD
jgi:hypothetical protein